MDNEQLEVYFAFRWAMSGIDARIHTELVEDRGTILVVASDRRHTSWTNVTREDSYHPELLDLLAERFTRYWENLVKEESECFSEV